MQRALTLLCAATLFAACAETPETTGTSVQEAVVTDCLPQGQFAFTWANPLPAAQAYVGGPINTPPGAVWVSYRDKFGTRFFYAAQPGQAAVNVAYSVKAQHLSSFLDQMSLAGAPAVPLPQPPRPPRMDELLVYADRAQQAWDNSRAINAEMSGWLGQQPLF